MINERYQNCRWYVRLWRRRQYLIIPFQAIRMWWLNRPYPENEMDFGTCWSVSIGLAQWRMNWCLSWDEVREDLDL